MMPAEAKWFGRALRDTDAAELSPILNLGSSTVEFRTVTKPHIDRELFAPLASRGVTVIHADLKEDNGVDVAGDFLEPVVQDEIRALGVRSIMCNNLLEHVTDVGEVCSALSRLCPAGGLLFISVPNQYPFHPDPIDNGFRPDIAQLSKILGAVGFELRSGDVIRCGSYVNKVKANPKLLVRDVYLLLAGIIRRDKLRMLRENYRYWRKDYRVTCAVFARQI
jgi:SAM-dependent methyltransferase